MGAAPSPLQAPPAPANRGGRPRGGKCSECSRRGRNCGSACPNWPGFGPSAQSATVTVPELPGAATPTATAPAASTLQDPVPPAGTAAARWPDPSDISASPPLPPLFTAAANTPTSGTAVASAAGAATHIKSGLARQRRSSERRLAKRDRDVEAVEWAMRASRTSGRRLRGRSSGGGQAQGEHCRERELF